MKVGMVEEYEQRYSIRIYKRPGLTREDCTIREGLEKMRSSDNDTTPATTIVGIVGLSDPTIPSWCVTAGARHCGTTALLFLIGSNENRYDSRRQINKPCYTCVSPGPG